MACSAGGLCRGLLPLPGLAGRASGHEDPHRPPVHLGSVPVAAISRPVPWTALTSFPRTGRGLPFSLNPWVPGAPSAQASRHQSQAPPQQTWAKERLPTRLERLHLWGPGWWDSFRGNVMAEAPGGRPAPQPSLARPVLHLLPAHRRLPAPAQRLQPERDTSQDSSFSNHSRS